jgi:hypothetical protein
LASDIGVNREKLLVLVSPPAMAFELPLLMIKIRQGTMTKSIIPWHIFNDAIETLNPYSLNLWLERWRFMDGGVVLFDANLPSLELTHTIFNLLDDKTARDDRDRENEMMHSPQPATSANKPSLH